MSLRIGATIAITSATVCAAFAAIPAGGQSAEPAVETFDEVGTAEYVVPEGVCQLEVDAIGAEGGSIGTFSTGGLGGHAQAIVPVNEGEELLVNVGGRGEDGLGGPTPAAGGFNGGGDGGAQSGTDQIGGSGGGGASDVRAGGFTEGERLVVAGGGGGSGNGSDGQGVNDANGGDGGGLAGGDGFSTDPTNAPDAGGGGGTQTTPGAGGDSGPSSSDGDPGVGSQGGDGGPQIGGPAAGGGGGGGWFGGGGGATFTTNPGAVGGGGGGSGFTPDGSGMTNGVDGENEGNGIVTISATPGEGCPGPPAPPTPSALVIEPRFTG